MTFAIIAFIAFFALGLLLLIVRRTVSLVFRLTVVGLMLLVLLAGALAWWWYGAGRESARPAGRRAPTETRRSR